MTAPDPAPPAPVGANTTDATKPCRNHPHHCPGCGRQIECGYVCCATCSPASCTPPAPPAEEGLKAFIAAQKPLPAEAAKVLHDMIREGDYLDATPTPARPASGEEVCSACGFSIMDGLGGARNADGSWRHHFERNCLYAQVARLTRELAEAREKWEQREAMDGLEAHRKLAGEIIAKETRRREEAEAALDAARAEAARLREALEPFARPAHTSLLSMLGTYMRDEVEAARRALTGGAT